MTLHLSNRRQIIDFTQREDLHRSIPSVPIKCKWNVRGASVIAVSLWLLSFHLASQLDTIDRFSIFSLYRPFFRLIFIQNDFHRSSHTTHNLLNWILFCNCAANVRWERCKIVAPICRTKCGNVNAHINNEIIIYDALFTILSRRRWNEGERDRYEWKEMGKRDSDREKKEKKHWKHIENKVCCGCCHTNYYRKMLLCHTLVLDSICLAQFTCEIVSLLIKQIFCLYVFFSIVRFKDFNRINILALSFFRFKFFALSFCSLNFSLWIFSL